MALPNIKLPTFFCELLSTKGKHKYHPYTVKDQELLLIALEGENKDEIVNACVDLVNNCVEGIKAEQLPIFDFEYLFLKLKIASSGDSIVLNVPHADNSTCDYKQEVELNLNNIIFEKDDAHTLKIELTDKIGIVMKYPTISDSIMTEPKEILFNCIDYIYDDQNVYSSKDTSKKELEEWIGNLEPKQMNKIKSFFDTMPKVQLAVEYTCDKCGVKERRTIEGFDNFFTTP